MSSTENTAGPAPSEESLAAFNQAAALPADSTRIRVLCPAGIVPGPPWPPGTAPVLAYLIYQPHPQPERHLSDSA
jgi:hypothetical protein